MCVCVCASCTVGGSVRVSDGEGSEVGVSLRLIMVDCRRDPERGDWNYPRCRRDAGGWRGVGP